jgi:phenylalanine-4-hydroxylase
MCLDKDGSKKAYGAGIMSSFGELEYCVIDKPQFKPFDPYVIAQDHITFPISEMQPLYVRDLKQKANKYITWWFVSIFDIYK